MVPGAIGEDELATLELLDRGAERRVGLERRVIDLVHEIEEVVRLHAVLGHQPAHRGAVALVIVLLQPERLLMADLEKLRDVAADALVHLLPQVDVMRIERVVEVEHPGVDVGKGTGNGAGWCNAHRATVEPIVRAAGSIPSPSEAGRGWPERSEGRVRGIVSAQWAMHSMTRSTPAHL